MPGPWVECKELVFAHDRLSAGDDADRQVTRLVDITAAVKIVWTFGVRLWLLSILGLELDDGVHARPKNVDGLWRVTPHERVLLRNLV